MKKLLILLLLLLLSCEREHIYPENIYSDVYINIYSDLELNNEIYTFEYPEDNLNSYFKISYNSLPYQRVFWESPDMFYVILWQDTIWTEVINFSTYANDEGIGHQMVYVNPSLIGDTLNLIGIIKNPLGAEIIREEILVKIQ
jgi:hypothetical protein